MPLSLRIALDDFFKRHPERQRHTALEKENLKKISPPPGKTWTISFQEDVKVPFVSLNVKSNINLKMDNGDSNHQFAWKDIDEEQSKNFANNSPQPSVVNDNQGQVEELPNSVNIQDNLLQDSLAISSKGKSWDILRIMITTSFYS
jgi:hypothetical protein